jgi:peptide/nickel transport system substrate-binding protein
MDLAFRLRLRFRWRADRLEGGSHANASSREIPMSTLRLLALGTLVMLAVGLGCRPADDPTAGPVGDPTPGGTAIVAVTSDFQAFNPVTNTALVTMEVINFMLFTPLVQYGEDLEPEPYLAQSWDLDENGVTFRLRPDVRWHDGQPVTAEDVKFTFDLAKNPEAASLLESAYLTMVESAQVIDPQTIRFEFVAPHSRPLEAFWWAPVPRHVLEGVAPGELAQAPFNREPVGSGPYRFVSWAAGQQVTLEANPDFPEELGGRPHLDRVVFRIVQEATTRLTEVLTGATDVNYTVLPDEARQVEGQRGVELIHYPAREFLYVGMNNARAPFDDPRVRLAVSHAIDRQGLRDAVLEGYAEPAAGMVPPWHPMNPGVDPIPYDMETARRLLAEAGWEDTTGDGLVDRGGQPLRFTLMLSEDRLRQDIATVLQQQFRRAGIDVRLQVMEFQALLAQHRGRTYQAVLASWILDTFRIDPTPLFSCEEARKPESANRAGYCNPEGDRLMMAGLAETNDGRAQEIWGDFTRRLQQDQPIAFLLWPESMAGVGPRIQGVEMDARGKLVSASRWWIPEDRRR